MPRRTRHRDSLGHARRVPLMLALRLRLAPAWAWKRHRAAVITAAVVVVLAAGLILHGHHPPACQLPAGTDRAACR